VRCSDREAYKVGGFADIFCGTYNHEEVALKRLRVFQAIEESRRKTLTKDFLRESIMWQSLKHEHVLPFLGVDNTVFQQVLCMVLPWMPHGNIRDVIDTWKSIDNRSIETQDSLAPQVHTWLHEIALGLAYLHDERIVHGDLRGANVLIDANRKVRLADFGLAVFAESMSNANSSKREGSVRWLAPEILDPERFNGLSSRPTYKSDVYSFGIVCVELYLGKAPFEHMPDGPLMRHILDGLRPPRPFFAIGNIAMPDALWELIGDSWHTVATDRPAATDLVERMASVRSLDTHASTYDLAHIGAGTFDCAWTGCNSTFSSSETRNDHERIHPHLNGYICARCEAPFTSLSAFKIHLLDNLECEATDRIIRGQRWNEACDLYERGFHTTALQLFSCIQGHSVIWVNRGIISSALARHESAIEEYEQAIALGHNSIFCDFQLGVSRYALGQFEPALECFENTLTRLKGFVGLNYQYVGLNYTLFTLKVLFNKGACLVRLDREEGYEILDNAGADMADAQVPDDREDGYSIYSLPIGVCFRPPDEKYHEL